MAYVQLRRVANNNAYDAQIKQVGMQVLAKGNLAPEEQAGMEHLLSARVTADAHFYLNCWRIVALNVFRIARAVGAEELKQFLIDQQCPTNNRGDSLYFSDAKESITLGWYAQGRDHFEHIDERIYGEKRWKELKSDTDKVVDLTERPTPEGVEYYPSPFFNGTYMLVGNSKWEITSRAHVQLLEAVDRVEEIGMDLLTRQVEL